MFLQRKGYITFLSSHKSIVGNVSNLVTFSIFSMAMTTQNAPLDLHLELVNIQKPPLRRVLQYTLHRVQMQLCFKLYCAHKIELIVTKILPNCAVLKYDLINCLGSNSASFIQYQLLGLSLTELPSCLLYTVTLLAMVVVEALLSLCLILNKVLRQSTQF